MHPDDAHISRCFVDTDNRVIDAEDGVLPVYSIAKTLTASLVIQAGIPLSHPVSRWFGDSLVPQGHEITIEHLLNHTSGLRDYGGDPEYHKAIYRRETPWSDEEFAARTLQQPLLFKPGAGWAYSNPGYWLLKSILEMESGTEYDNLVNSQIVQALNLQHTTVAEGVFMKDLPNYPAGWVWPGVILSSARDMATFMRSSLVAPLMTAPVPVPVSHPDWQNPYYGYGVMIEPGVRVGHNGGGPGYSAACFHRLDTGVTGCILMSSETDEDAAASALFAELDSDRRRTP